MPNALTEQLRAALQPRGTAPLVRLALRNHGFVEHAMVQAAIAEIEVAHPQVRTGMRELNALEKLALLLLSESAGIGDEPGAALG